MLPSFPPNWMETEVFLKLRDEEVKKGHVTRVECRCDSCDFHAFGNRLVGGTKLDEVDYRVLSRIELSSSGLKAGFEDMHTFQRPGCKGNLRMD